MAGLGVAMLWSIDVIPQIETGLKCPVGRRSGRYQFKNWDVNANGERVATASRDSFSRPGPADLINTAYRNSDGTRTVYGLAFDLDAHRADVKWLDPDGRLDWQKISVFLSEKHAPISRLVSHAVRSSGGKGLALIVAITPLPIRTSTSGNQLSAQNLQSRLIHFFRDLGLGADTGARGLERDFPNFQNPERCLLENRLLLRRLEKGDEAVLTDLHGYLNVLAAAQKRKGRLYPDDRVELGLAKLLLWLLGARDPSVSGLSVPGYYTGEEVWASTRQLQLITGLSDKFLRKLLKRPPTWLRAAYVAGEGWRLRAVLGRSLQRLIPRAEGLLAPKAPGQSTSRKPMFFAGALRHPSLIGDGERNGWLTGMALAYKWAGLVLDQALPKLLLRLKAMPGYEASRNCRQVRSIIKAIYKNVPETFGRLAFRGLADWMTDDQQFQFFKEGTSTRRGFAPVWLADVSQDAVIEQARASKLASLNPCAPVFSANFERCSGVSIRQAPIASQPDLKNRPQPRAGTVVILAAIRRRQRVGVFEGDRLVLCTTRRHYRASLAAAYLSRRPEYAGKRLTIYTPHRGEQDAYFPLIDGSGTVVKSEVLGQRKTFAEKARNWAEEKETSLGKSVLDKLFQQVPF